MNLFWSHQQQLCYRGGGGHGVPVDSVDLKGPRHAPHSLVGGQDLLITNQNSVWVFNWEDKENGDICSVNHRTKAEFMGFFS